MASGVLQLFVCFAFVCVVCGQSAQISMTPANLVTMPTGFLEIKCSRSGSFKEIYTVGLKKNGTSGFSNIITFTKSGVTHSTSNSDNMEGRATVTGSLSTNTSDPVLLTVSLDKSQVKCSDAGTYKCQILGLDSNGGASRESSPRSVQVVAEPRRMSGIVVQSNGAVLSSAEVNQGDNLTLTCSGEVGHNATAGNTLEIRFCVKGSSTTGQSDFAFFGTTNTATQGDLDPLQNCQYNRSASVAYTVTNQYDHLQFLCESGYSNQCGTGTAKKDKNFTVASPNTNTAPQGDGSTSSGSAGVIVGVIVGVLAFLFLIILLVYFLVIRGKGGGDTYRTKEDQPEHNIAPEGPVYSIPNKEKSDMDGGHRRDRPRDNDRHREHDRGRDYRRDRDHDQDRRPTVDEDVGPKIPPIPPKRELHYADLDIATKPPGTQNTPGRRREDSPTEKHESHENKGLDEPHTEKKGSYENINDLGKINPALADESEDGNGTLSPGYQGSTV